MLARVLLQVAIVIVVLLALSTALFIGRDRLARTRREFRERLRAIAPIAIVLGCLLLFNNVAREVGPEISWIVNWNVTWVIYDLEGDFVIWLQSFATPQLTAYFSFIYIYGYVFLAAFPLIAYFTLPDTRPVRELLASYTCNYALGLLCYILIIAYGPRNLMPELVEALLYDTYPQYQLLTRQVNRNTNVFPSLHTSLSVTVALMAYRTRQEYHLWLPVAVFLAISVAISTMYLGIHWATDVAAGVVLAFVSVGLAARLVDR